MVELPELEWEVYDLFPYITHLDKTLEVGLYDLLPLEI